MKVQVVPLTDFVHGSVNALEGHAIELDEGLAGDLERAGLVRIRLAPQVNRVVAKTPDDGPGQPSSSSVVAPVSPSTTLHLPARGPGRPRKDGS